MMHRLRRLLVTGLAVLLVTVAAVGAASLAMQHRHGGGRSLDSPVDAAIVLGGGVDPDGILGWSSRRRVAAGVELLRDGRADRLIMSGGTVGHSDASAARLMREHAITLGAPPGSVLVEEKSRSTFENIRYSFRIAREAGFNRLAIVSDAGHLPRAASLACYFGNCGIELAAVPAFRHSPAPDIARDIGREALAWWYNLGKVALWTALGAAGMPEHRRAGLIE